MRIGVCSWSLQASSPADLAAKVRACGLQHVQLALRPIREGAWDLEATRAALSGAGITILSGMMEPKGEDYSTLDTIRVTGGVRPTVHWQANVAIAKADALLAKRLGLTLVTTHAGFMPVDSGDPEHAVMQHRLRTLVDIFAAEGVMLAFETGQEPAPKMLEMLRGLDRKNTGVNFDPANMILYGTTEPVWSVELLAPWVRQGHVKDALPCRAPGTWGTEVPAGEGAVMWQNYLATLRRLGLDIDLVIEREAGTSRVEDVKKAKAMLALHGMHHG